MLGEPSKGLVLRSRRIRQRRIAWVVIVAASLLMPLAANGGGTRRGTLPPAVADETARRDLLSVLQPTGKFKKGPMGVETATFVTWPFEDRYPGLCREDELVVGYGNIQRYDKDGRLLYSSGGPENLKSQPIFHLDQIPVPYSTYELANCDPRHPGPQAAWFAAPTAADAVRAANLFRMAEDQVKAGNLAPGPCPGDGPDACRRRVVALDDFSKVTSVGACTEAAGDDACYVFSLADAELTVAGKMSQSEPTIPTAITSVRAREVITVTE